MDVCLTSVFTRYRYCIPNEIIIKNGTRCSTCPEFKWPDPITATNCLDIDWTYLKWSSMTTIGIVLLSSLGMATCAMVMIFFMMKQGTKLIKATSVHLSMITLVGVVIAYPSALLMVIPPTSINCKLSVIGMHLSFCMTYASLLTVSSIRDSL